MRNPKFCQCGQARTKAKGRGNVRIKGVLQDQSNRVNGESTFFVRFCCSVAPMSLVLHRGELLCSSLDIRGRVKFSFPCV